MWFGTRGSGFRLPAEALAKAGLLSVAQRAKVSPIPIGFTDMDFKHGTVCRLRAVDYKQYFYSMIIFCVFPLKIRLFAERSKKKIDPAFAGY
jgi:hypothetical protein